jgi:polysaccharide pyruvyl transferase WcaK-like protein
LRLLVYGGWFGSGNIGDDAILIGLREILHEIMWDPEIVTLSTDPIHTRKICKVEAIPLQNLKSLLTGGIKHYSDLFKKHDACLISGGTPFYDYGYLSRIIHMGLPRVTRRPLYCFGVGSKKIFSPWGRIITSKLLDGVRKISVRDEPTLRVLGELTGEPITITGDSAMFLETVSRDKAYDILEKEGVNINKPMVAICPRALSANHKNHYHDPVNAVTTNNILSQLSLSTRYLSERGYQIVLVPMHKGGYDSDLPIIMKIMDLAQESEARLLLRDLRPEEIKGIFECMELVVGLRLHSLIIAASALTPVISINYDDKIKGFMNLMGLRGYLSHPQGSWEVLKNQLDIVLKQKIVLREKIRYRIRKTKKIILDEARAIQNDLENNNQ